MDTKYVDKKCGPTTQFSCDSKIRRHDLEEGLDTGLMNLKKPFSSIELKARLGIFA